MRPYGLHMLFVEERAFAPADPPDDMMRSCNMVGKGGTLKGSDPRTPGLV